MATSPVPLFRPMMAVNFRIRFDEAFQPEGASKAPDLQPPAPSLSPSTPLSALPKAMTGTQDSLSHIHGTVPMRCTVELPGYRIAGKWTIEMPFRDFPFDPRAVRACAVEIHLGCISDQDFATGMVTTPAQGRARASQLVTRDAGGGIRKDTLLLIGYMDTICVHHDAKGSTVAMEGRDVRSAFLDCEWTMPKLDLSKPIDDVVRQIISKHPLGAGYTVGIQPDDWDGKIPSPTTDVNRWQQSADGSRSGLGMKVDPHSMNFWDAITFYCYVCGAIPYFVGEELRIRRARSLYDLATPRPYDSRALTPFAGNKQRSVDGPKGSFETPIRIMAFGRDILEMKFERKLAMGRRVIRCISQTTSATKGQRGFKNHVVQAVWPREFEAHVGAMYPDVFGSPGLPVVPGLPGKGKNPKATQVAASGALVQANVLTVPIAGMNSKQRLTEIARDIYEEVARGELGGCISTRNMASLGGDANDPDLVGLRPGDAIRLTVDAQSLQTYSSDQPPPIHELIDTHRKSAAELKRDLTARLGDDKIAGALATALSGEASPLPSIFRVSNVKYTWAADSGVAIDFDFQNYIEARGDTTGGTGAVVPKPPQRKST